MKKDGCGVLVTTHVMSEAEMTDSVALLMDVGSSPTTPRPPSSNPTALAQLKRSS